MLSDRLRHISPGKATRRDDAYDAVGAALKAAQDKHYVHYEMVASFGLRATFKLMAFYFYKPTG